MININKNFLARWYASKEKKAALDFLGKENIKEIDNKDELALLYELVVSKLSQKLALIQIESLEK